MANCGRAAFRRRCSKLTTSTPSRATIPCRGRTQRGLSVDTELPTASIWDRKARTIGGCSARTSAAPGRLRCSEPMPSRSPVRLAPFAQKA